MLKMFGRTLLVIKFLENKTKLYIPIMVTLEGADVSPDVKGGNNFNATLKAEGSVWTFGNNINGELGLGDKDRRNVPNKVELQNDEMIEEIAVRR